MKKLIIKLDDIGRESHRPIFDTVLWAMEQKIPVSIGTIGNVLRFFPAEVTELIKVGIKLGFIEVWNHGYRHIRYDQNDMDTVMADLNAGHKAVCDLFGTEPAGFGFPFNKSTPELVAAIRNTYANYFIYESDFTGFKLLSPEFNSLADGQPRLSYFMHRLGAGKAIPQRVVLQAHPPRWTNIGFAAFKQCIETLIEQYGFLCVTGSDEAESFAYTGIRSNTLPLTTMLSGKIGNVTELWTCSSDEFTATLSNFKSYYLRRFTADAERNFFHVRRLLYPFKPKNVLDIGCGLGNWSLPFLLSDSCESLVMNDTNATIIQALQIAMTVIDTKGRIALEPLDLLQIPDKHGYRVDFIVCANTFNYLDPIDFFCFVQSAIEPGGRLLLMYQTDAFNKQRYRNAFESRDASVLSEVLSCDLAMLMRRMYRLQPTQVRHCFSTEEISKLAIMFDFAVESRFIPHGESLEVGENVYECLIFRHRSGMKKAIMARDEWLTECKTSIVDVFGHRALSVAGFPGIEDGLTFSFTEKWNFPENLICAADAAALQSIKKAILDIRQGRRLNKPELANTPQPVKALAERVISAGRLFA